MQYPKSNRHKTETKLHGKVIIDDYEWLSKDDNPDTGKWIEEQNKLTQDYLRGIPERDKIFDRLNRLRRYDTRGIPHKCRRSGIQFYSRKNKDDDNKIMYIKKNDEDERVFLNMNDHPSDESLDVFEPSWDGSYVAVGITKGGNENPKIRIIKTDTMEFLEDELYAQRVFQISWLPDNSGFYYSGFPREGDVDNNEHYFWSSAYFHKLGTSGEDRKVFSHPSCKEYYHFVNVSSDGRHLIYTRNNFSKTEVFFSSIEDEGDLKEIAAGFTGRYSMDIVNDSIIIYTSDNNPRGIIYKADKGNYSKNNWRELIKAGKEEVIEYFSLINGRIFVSMLIDVQPKLCVYSLEGEYLREIPMPSIGYVGASGDWDSDEIYLFFTSFNIPFTIYRYDYENNKIIEYFKPELDDFDPDIFHIKQVFYESKDKTRVSMFIVHRKDLDLKETKPVLVTGYGGFGIPWLPSFSPGNALWIEAGGILAYVNLRGGGEYGEEWHKAGMFENKQNVFDDFIYAIKWLINNNYTKSSQVAISGGSNGGLLVGAVMAQVPELIKAVSCSVPLLDMINYHKYSIGEIWKCEYGYSENKEEFEYILKYSPYHNIKSDIKYPSVLFSAGGNDARVHPVHARKMSALMQENDKNDLILYREFTQGGHGGSAALSDSIAEGADQLAFLMNCIGFDKFMGL